MSLHIAFRVGDAEYAVPAAHVLHLESFDTATPVPGAPPYVAGLVQVRGRVVPVVDLRARFGLPPAERALAQATRRVIIVQVGPRVAGLLVDGAREVLQLDEGAFSKPPELVEEGADGFVRGVAALKQRLILLVDVPRVIGEELAS